MFYLLLFLLTITTKSIKPRNPRRNNDSSIPMITVSSTNSHLDKTWASRKSKYSPNKPEYRLKSSFLRLKPIKYGFDEQFFQKNYLPSDSFIEYRNNSGIVSTTTLSNLANELVEEIKVGQKVFTHFKILKNKDFNYKTLSGLLILKYKDYPFVIKISIEHPHTIVQPFSKSLEADGMFIIGGNIRHLSNFTRISNLHRIKKILCYNPFYLFLIDFPRKWYWKPKKSSNLNIVWECNNEQETIILPTIYATISDFIETEPYQPQTELNKLSMKIATDVGFLIDPHAGNIVIEKGSRKYVLIDTEDFRLMVGLNKSMNSKKYIGWYIELICNYLKTYCCRTKKERLKQTLFL